MSLGNKSKIISVKLTQNIEYKVSTDPNIEV